MFALPVAIGQCAGLGTLMQGERMAHVVKRGPLRLCLRPLRRQFCTECLLGNIAALLMIARKACITCRFTFRYLLFCRLKGLLQ